MNFRKLDKDKKIFIVIGIPIFTFLIIFFFTHYIQITFFFILIMGIMTAGLLRKNRIYLRLTKIGLFTFIIYIVMFNNVLFLPNQFERRLPGGRNALIDPDHEEVEEFKKDFYGWHLDKYNESFNNLSENTWEKLELKLLRVDNYIRGKRFDYTYDAYPPYSYYDHLPSIDEIFESENKKGDMQDDCDGITILTVSLLIHMGYNAWVVETEYHYYTLVFPEGEDPKSTEGFKEGIHLYNSGKKPSYMLFNDEETFIPPTFPIQMTLYDLFTGTSMWETYFLGFFTGRYFTVHSFVLNILIGVLCFLIALGLTFYVKLGISMKELNKKIRRKKFLKVVLVNTLICSMVILLLYWFSISGLGSLGNLTLTIGLIFTLRYTDKSFQKSRQPLTNAPSADGHYPQQQADVLNAGMKLKDNRRSADKSFN